MPKCETVTVGDRTFVVHPMTAGQLVRWHAYLTSPAADKITADFQTFALCVRDGEGKAVWANSQDAEGMSVEERIAIRPLIAKVNGFDAEDDDEKKV